MHEDAQLSWANACIAQWHRARRITRHATVQSLLGAKNELVSDTTYSLHCSSFLGLPYRILNIILVKPKKGTTIETLGNSFLPRGNPRVGSSRGMGLLYRDFTVLQKPK